MRRSTPASTVEKPTLNAWREQGAEQMLSRGAVVGSNVVERRIADRMPWRSPAEEWNRARMPGKRIQYNQESEGVFNRRVPSPIATRRRLPPGVKSSSGDAAQRFVQARGAFQPARNSQEGNACDRAVPCAACGRWGHGCVTCPELWGTPGDPDGHKREPARSGSVDNVSAVTPSNAEKKAAGGAREETMLTPTQRTQVKTAMVPVRVGKTVVNDLFAGTDNAFTMTTVGNLAYCQVGVTPSGRPTGDFEKDLPVRTALYKGEEGVKAKSEYVMRTDDDNVSHTTVSCGQGVNLTLVGVTPDLNLLTPLEKLCNAAEVSLVTLEDPCVQEPGVTKDNCSAALLDTTKCAASNVTTAKGESVMGSDMLYSHNIEKVLLLLATKTRAAEVSLGASMESSKLELRVSQDDSCAGLTGNNDESMVKKVDVQENLVTLPVLVTEGLSSISAFQLPKPSVSPSLTASMSPGAFEGSTERVDWESFTKSILSMLKGVSACNSKTETISAVPDRGAASLGADGSTCVVAAVSPQEVQGPSGEQKAAEMVQETPDKYKNGILVSDVSELDKDWANKISAVPVRGAAGQLIEEGMEAAAEDFLPNAEGQSKDWRTAEILSETQEQSKGDMSPDKLVMVDVPDAVCVTKNCGLWNEVATEDGHSVVRGPSADTVLSRADNETYVNTIREETVPMPDHAQRTALKKCGYVTDEKPATLGTSTCQEEVSSSGVDSTDDNGGDNKKIYGSLSSTINDHPVQLDYSTASALSSVEAVNELVPNEGLASDGQWSEQLPLELTVSEVTVGDGCSTGCGSPADTALQNDNMSKSVEQYNTAGNYVLQSCNDLANQEKVILVVKQGCVLDSDRVNMSAGLCKGAAEHHTDKGACVAAAGFPLKSQKQTEKPAEMLPGTYERVENSNKDETCSSMSFVASNVKCEVVNHKGLVARSNDKDASMECNTREIISEVKAWECRDPNDTTGKGTERMEMDCQQIRGTRERKASTEIEQGYIDKGHAESDGRETCTGVTLTDFRETVMDKVFGDCTEITCKETDDCTEVVNVETWGSRSIEVTGSFVEGKTGVTLFKVRDCRCWKHRRKKVEHIQTDCLGTCVRSSGSEQRGGICGIVRQYHGVRWPQSHPGFSARGAEWLQEDSTCTRRELAFQLFPGCLDHSWDPGARRFLRALGGMKSPFLGPCFGSDQHLIVHLCTSFMKSVLGCVQGPTCESGELHPGECWSCVCAGSTRTQTTSGAC